MTSEALVMWRLSLLNLHRCCKQRPLALRWVLQAFPAATAWAAGLARPAEAGTGVATAVAAALQCHAQLSQVALC